MFVCPLTDSRSRMSWVKLRSLRVASTSPAIAFASLMYLLKSGKSFSVLLKSVSCSSRSFTVFSASAIVVFTLAISSMTSAAPACSSTSVSLMAVAMARRLFTQCRLSSTTRSRFTSSSTSSTLGSESIASRIWISVWFTACVSYALISSSARRSSPIMESRSGSASSADCSLSSVCEMDTMVPFTSTTTPSSSSSSDANMVMFGSAASLLLADCMSLTTVLRNVMPCPVSFRFPRTPPAMSASLDLTLSGPLPASSSPVGSAFSLVSVSLMLDGNGRSLFTDAFSERRSVDSAGSSSTGITGRI
mmetsp:Transcript_29113/g.94950  ORF Transcript_29113/g.94950 Transcript_29113/m.94950 type:complete len:305 (-) Transcript_29113:1048-1962(-)